MILQKDMNKINMKLGGGGGGDMHGNRIKRKTHCNMACQYFVTRYDACQKLPCLCMHYKISS